VKRPGPGTRTALAEGADMPDPGSHAYDIKRTRLRAQYDDSGTPDQHADRAANEQLQREHPPRRPDDPRADGPLGARDDSGTDVGPPPAPGGLLLRSPAFTDHAPIPGRHAADGEDVPPALEWSPAPDGTAELVLLCEDLDAPGGSATHWVVTAIPPTATGIDGSGLPDGARVGPNDRGGSGWAGPRPPVGDEAHRYAFRLYAVDRPLDLAPDATGRDVKAAAEAHRLATGTLVGLFAR
jgi:Raf kinase inhibitor-like YbhB/YbcL family protein